MKAELKYLHSPDIDLYQYIPEESDNFGFLLQAMIGSEGKEGEDSFDIIVCTTKWFQSNYVERMPLLGYSFMFVSQFSLEEIEQAIQIFCKECTGETWIELASKLSKLGKWEFEGYKAYTS